MRSQSLAASAAPGPHAARRRDPAGRRPCRPPHGPHHLAHSSSRWRSSTTPRPTKTSASSSTGLAHRQRSRRRRLPSRHAGAFVTEAAASCRWQTVEDLRADGVRGGCTKEFEPTKVKFHKDKAFTGIDGCYGLLASASHRRRRGPRGGPTSSALVAHRARLLPGPPGSFDVFSSTARAPGGSRHGRRWRARDGSRSTWRMRRPGRASYGGRRDVRSSDDPRPPGAGSSSTRGHQRAADLHAAALERGALRRQLRHASRPRRPAYCTNEGSSRARRHRYERKLVDFLGRIARAAPTSSCLLLGRRPRAHTKGQDDWRSLPRLAEIVALQRKVAERGIGFYDQQEAMGGAGASSGASEPDFARPARPCASHARLRRVRRLLGDLMRAYDEWRRAWAPADERAAHLEGDPR